MTKGKTLVEVFEEEERSLSPPMRGALAYMFALEAECKDDRMCPNVGQAYLRRGGSRINGFAVGTRFFRRPSSSTLRALLRRGLIEETICKLDYETKEYGLTDAGRDVAADIESRRGE